MIPIVLASASPRRKALLADLGIEFTVQVSNADETLDGNPRNVVLQNAIVKRDEVARTIADESIIIAADTIVVLDDHIMGKPVDLEEATRMLEKLSGQTHEVLTAVAIANTKTQAAAEDIETTEVTFRDLSAHDIDRFVQTVKPLDRAGAYTVDGPGTLLVARYNGCYQNVLGLPITLLDTLLHQLGDALIDRMRPSETRFL